MALRAVPDHPKFADLKQRLGISKGAALGYLECVWHFTGRFTPQGNVGKYSDSQIEAWVEWDGQPGALIAGLADSRWIDRDPKFRLIIHDWPANADELVHTTLARQCIPFADGTMPKAGRLNQKEREKFKEWTDFLASNPTARQVSDKISQESAEISQAAAKVSLVSDKLTDHSDSLTEASANAPGKSANPPDFSANVPKPVPEPEPVPEPAPAPEPAKETPLSPAEAADRKLKDLGWQGVSKTSDAVCEAIAALRLDAFPESTKLDSPFMIYCRLCWFDEFWEYYWRKENKKTSRAAYFKAVETLEMKDRLDEAVIAQYPNMVLRETEKQPLASTWLNGERWNNTPKQLPLEGAA